jgi:hypothetical protein
MVHLVDAPTRRIVVVTRRLGRFAAIGIVAVATWPSPAAAAERVRFTDRPLTLNAVVGVATPVGEIGVLGEYSITSRFTVGAGAGANLYGPAFGVVGGYRALFFERASAQALAIRLGLSEGPYQTPSWLFGLLENQQVVKVTHTYWVQAEAGYELLASSGFHLLVATGIAMPFAASDARCDNAVGVGTNQPCGDLIDKVYAPLWTFTVALGFGVDP